MISTAPSTSEASGEVKIGNYVTIGHGAVLHACTVEDETLIGMGAVIQEQSVVGKHSIVAAGAVVEPGTQIPEGQLWGGNPAVFKRNVNEKELAFFTTSAENYYSVSQQHKEEFLPETTQFTELESK